MIEWFNCKKSTNLFSWLPLYWLHQYIRYRDISGLPCYQDTKMLWCSSITVLLLDLCFSVLNKGPSHLLIYWFFLNTHKPYLPPLPANYYQLKVEKIFICVKVIGQDKLILCFLSVYIFFIMLSLLWLILVFL